MDGQVSSTGQTPPSQQDPAGAGSFPEGLDVFDLQLRKDCENKPGSFLANLAVSPGAASPSPPTTWCTAMFSSAATTTHGLSSTMSNPQVARRMMHDVAQTILTYISANGEPQPENLSDEYQRQLILQFADELQRISAPFPQSSTGAADGRLTIDKEVVISLKNGRDGPPPSGAEVPRPHHPFAVHSGALIASPKQISTQPLWRVTPPGVAGPAHAGAPSGTAALASGGGGGNARSGGDAFSPSATGAHYVGLTATTLSKRVGGGDVIRPRPQQLRGSGKLMGQRHAMPSTKKVLRSASSAFSECSAGETGEVWSSMSRTTAGTYTLTK